MLGFSTFWILNKIVHKIFLILSYSTESATFISLSNVNLNTEDKIIFIIFIHAKRNCFTRLTSLFQSFNGFWQRFKIY